MSKIDNILETYDNYELGYMLKYKYDIYSDKSKLEIDHFLEKKKLLKEDLLQLTNEKRVYSDEKKRCPRCKSEKCLINPVQYYSRSSYKSFFEYETTDIIICQICGFKIKDYYSGSSNNFISKVIIKIKELFKNNYK
jgi:uncharacterized protein with PIN domain